MLVALLAPLKVNQPLDLNVKAALDETRLQLDPMPPKGVGFTDPLSATLNDAPREMWSTPGGTDCQHPQAPTASARPAR